MARVELHPEPIALSQETVDKLIGQGSGDAALLYLYLLRRGGEYSTAAAQKALGWNAAQVMGAFARLCELGLAQDDLPPERKNAPKPEDCPAYTTEDITAELSAPASDFRGLLEEMERLLGKKCSVTELRILLELYDHLAMPAEVLLLLTARMLEDAPGQIRPRRKAPDGGDQGPGLPVEAQRHRHPGGGRGLAEKAGLPPLPGGGAAPGRGDHRPDSRGGRTALPPPVRPSGASGPRRSIWPMSAPCCAPAA